MLIPKNQKKNISQNNKDESPKNLMARKLIQIMTKKIFIRKIQSSLKVEKNKISLKNGAPKILNVLLLRLK